MADLPQFRDTFEVAEGADELEVRVQWSIGKGHAAIVLTPPGGDVVNRTDEQTEGPTGDGSFRVPSTPGRWDFLIPTWRADDGAFPSGEVQVDVLAR